MTDYSKYSIILVVSGCRHYEDFDEIQRWTRCYIYMLIMRLGLPEDAKVLIIQGECKTGVDKIIKQVATEFGYDYEGFEADWDKHGNSAGPIRNRVMGSKGKFCLAFKCKRSRGTTNMIEAAGEYHLPTMIVYN